MINMEFVMGKTLDREGVLRSKLNIPHICKYCRRRFFLHNWPRYRSHLAHHELRYLPYFFMRKPDQTSESANLNCHFDVNNNDTIPEMERLKTFDEISKRGQTLLQRIPSESTDTASTDGNSKCRTDEFESLRKTDPLIHTTSNPSICNAVENVMSSSKKGYNREDTREVETTRKKHPKTTSNDDNTAEDGDMVLYNQDCHDNRMRQEVFLQNVHLQVVSNRDITDEREIAQGKSTPPLIQVFLDHDHVSSSKCNADCASPKRDREINNNMSQQVYPEKNGTARNQDSFVDVSNMKSEMTLGFSAPGLPGSATIIMKSQMTPDSALDTGTTNVTKAMIAETPPAACSAKKPEMSPRQDTTVPISPVDRNITDQPMPLLSKSDIYLSGDLRGPQQSIANETDTSKSDASGRVDPSSLPLMGARGDAKFSKSVPPKPTERSISKSASSESDNESELRMPIIPTSESEGALAIPSDYPKVYLQRLVLSQYLLDAALKANSETCINADKAKLKCDQRRHRKRSPKTSDSKAKKKHNKSKKKYNKSKKKHKKSKHKKAESKQILKPSKKESDPRLSSPPNQSSTNQVVARSDAQSEKLSQNTLVANDAKKQTNITPENYEFKQKLDASLHVNEAKNMTNKKNCEMKQLDASQQDVHRSSTTMISVSWQQCQKEQKPETKPFLGNTASLLPQDILDYKTPSPDYRTQSPDRNYKTPSPDRDCKPFNDASMTDDTDDDKKPAKPKPKRHYDYTRRVKPDKDIPYEFSVKAKPEDAKNPYHICKYCNKVFPKASSRKVHELIHTNERRYKCNYCDRTFIQNSNRRSHEKKHLGITETFTCDFCEREFTCNSKRRQHEKMHNVGVAPFIQKYTCKICDKSFASSSAIRKHYRTHTGERPFQCTFCDKTFSQKGNMRIHELIHIGDRNYACEICKKTFLRKNDLRIHVMTHRGEKPYPCRYCGRCFSQGSHRASHERGHNNERPYHCK